jgi:hypothetical protein
MPDLRFSVKNLAVETLHCNVCRAKRETVGEYTNPGSTSAAASKAGSTASIEDSNPGLTLRLAIENSLPQEEIQSISLNAQIQIQPTRRRYSSEEKIALRVLFGEPESWHRSMRPLFWANVSLQVSAFLGSTFVDLKLPSSSSFNDAAITFSRALREGAIPLDLLFSGTVFYRAGDSVQAAFIAWSKEASWQIPLAIWKENMADGLPDADTNNAAPVWEQVLEHARVMAGKIKVIK